MEQKIKNPRAVYGLYEYLGKKNIQIRKGPSYIQGESGLEYLIDISNRTKETLGKEYSEETEDRFNYDIYHQKFDIIRRKYTKINRIVKINSLKSSNNLIKRVIGSVQGVFIKKESLENLISDQKKRIYGLKKQINPEIKKTNVSLDNLKLGIEKRYISWILLEDSIMNSNKEIYNLKRNKKKLNIWDISKKKRISEQINNYKNKMKNLNFKKQEVQKSFSTYYSLIDQTQSYINFIDFLNKELFWHRDLLKSLDNASLGLSDKRINY